MPQHPRYRFESDMHSIEPRRPSAALLAGSESRLAIDVRVVNIDQLFDNRDPAPFRERDLDPDLVDLVDAAEDLARHGPFRVVLWCAAAPSAQGIEAAFRAHFSYELDRVAREGRRRRAVGAAALVLGIGILAVLQALAQVRSQISAVAGALREGLVIFSWVVLWRPVDGFVYDWIPAKRRRAIIVRLLDAPIVVRQIPDK